MSFLIPFFIATTLGVAMTLLIQRLSLAIGFVDAPDGHRKLQAGAVALGGGVAILASAAAAISLVVWLKWDVAEAILRQPRFTLGLLAASSLICVVGLLDDALSLRGRQKLFAQLIAVLIVVMGGLQIDKVELFGATVELGVLAVPLTAFWLLGAINALNLIDGIDGLAGTVGLILSVTVAALAMLKGQAADAAFAWALAGGILGFLVFNLPPARIYMGDAGSMVIGLVLGALAIRASLKGPTTVALAAPTAIWAVLIFDVLMAILRRKLTGRSVYATDRAHLHHVLQRRGLSGLRVVGVIALMCIICAAGGLISVAIKSELMAVGTAVAVLATLVATGYFGRSEVGLLAQRCRNFGVSMLRIPSRTPEVKEPIVSRFHGNREWERLWQSLVEFAERFDLSIVQLNVSSPRIGEEFHASWARKSHPPLNRLWRTEIPVFHKELSVGRLIVMGGVGEGEVVAWMSSLMEGLRPFEIELTALLNETTDQPVAACAETVDEIDERTQTVSFKISSVDSKPSESRRPVAVDTK